MQYINNSHLLLPLLWKLIEKKKCAINITSDNNELTVSIIRKKRTTRFKNEDSEKLISDLQEYLQAS